MRESDRDVASLQHRERYETRTSLDSRLPGQSGVTAGCVRLLHARGSVCRRVGNHIAPGGKVVPLDIAPHPVFMGHGLVPRNPIVRRFGHGRYCAGRFSGRGGYGGDVVERCVDVARRRIRDLCDGTPGTGPAGKPAHDRGLPQGGQRPRRPGPAVRGRPIFF